ncbi:hypothetical protein B7494_g7011 [Chlorociboria aeruginascens]|nr:hypothetical protein B7494_g7011 [Chlorociboria aeruginascens]
MSSYLDVEYLGRSPLGFSPDSTASSSEMLSLTNTPLFESNFTSTTSLPSVDFIMTKVKTAVRPARTIQVTISYQSTQWDIAVSPDERSLVTPYIELFSSHLSMRFPNDNDTVDPKPSSPASLASIFLEYLLQEPHISKYIIRLVLDAFETSFLTGVDIHSLALRSNKSVPLTVLKVYFTALKVTNSSPRPADSALLRSAEIGDSRLYGIFGGQGSVSSTCLEDLIELYSVYGVLLEDLVNVVASTLRRLTSLPRTTNYYQALGFDIQDWLQNPETIPSQAYISSAPLSVPLIGLLSLSHYCITCKMTGKSPGELRDTFQGVTGHSQGVIVAVAIARSQSWDDFFESVQMIIEMLFWIGFESHHETPSSSLSSTTINESLDFAEGQPSPMLSIRGLDQIAVQKLLRETNAPLAEKDQVYLALINSEDNIVVAGPRKSLRGLNLHLRKMEAGRGLDQSRLPFNQRKPVCQHRYLPISAAFHSPHLKGAVNRVLQALSPQSIRGDDLGIAVIHTRTGEDLRSFRSQDVRECVLQMVMTDLVDWPRASTFAEPTHVIDFGPGRIGSLVHQKTEGSGVRVIMASEILPMPRNIGNKSEIFEPFMPPLSPNWGEIYRPKLKRDANGDFKLDTKMTRLFGAPPVMVAGMTPTTVPWDFVAAIMNSGYHVELAGGGYFNAKDFEDAVKRISNNVQNQRGITCNLIYASPRAMAWQIPLIRQLNRDGYLIDGLTIGAGVPSPEIVREYVETLGLRHISFKPGSYQSILDVVEIAKAHPNFPIGLQWTGGRGGGHHSFEDFHAPVIKAYGKIRNYPNIVLIAGSGFGDSNDTYPYLTGEWSESLGYAKMPFDGILLGSRMMAAKEAHTSPQAKALIIQTEGTGDSEWHKSYTGSAGGVITVNSEMGQPIHKLATRGVLLWKEFDKDFFSIKDQTKRLLELQKHRKDIIASLNEDFQKPWFPISASKPNADLEDMTYLEVLTRLISLMYIPHQKRWIDSSYEQFVLDFIARAQERLDMVLELWLDNLQNPEKCMLRFARSFPTAETELLHPEDISYFIGLCRRPGQKPVNFIPRLDENFETWFKKDSLWQAEDIDAVIGQDVQRVCIIHGPVAARYSHVVDEPCQTILDGIAKAHVEMLCCEDDSFVSIPSDDSGEDSLVALSEELDNVFVEDLPGERVLRFATSGDLPDLDSLVGYFSRRLVGWAQACLVGESIFQGQYRRPNPVRKAMAPRHGHAISVRYSERGKISSISMNSPKTELRPSRTLLEMSCSDESQVSVILFEPNPCGKTDIALEFKFIYSPQSTSCPLIEEMEYRNQRIKEFYGNLWLGHYSSTLADRSIHGTFSSDKITVTREMVQDFMTVIGSSDSSQSIQESIGDCVPLDFCVVVAWDVLIKPLLITDIDGDLLSLLHQSNRFEYSAAAQPIQIGDTLETTSRISAVTIQPSGKLIEVLAEIRREKKRVVTVTSVFFIQGSFFDFENTFRYTEEPGMEISVIDERMEALLLSRGWFDACNTGPELIGETVHFKLMTQVTYDTTTTFSSLQVTGEAYTKCGSESQVTVGKIFLESGPCHGNPVTDFLTRYGSPSNEPQSLKNPGWNGISSFKISIPMLNDAYARVSADTNPIHVSPIFASYAQLPGIVTHGMFTSAAVRRVVEQAAAEADSTRFRKYHASFQAMVMPGDELRVEMQHVAMIEGRMILKIQAYNDVTAEKVLDAEAEIEQPPTAYVFTGQGSQEKGMGMSLYESSPAAKAFWDRGDKHLMELYDIVRNDPKELTIHFRGKRGRKILSNYLAMTTETITPSGQTITEPMIRRLTPKSTFHTFKDVRGLLYSTQFAQPAIVLMELATFEDLRSQGLIQQNAPFAGHSLGEYAVLGALGNVMSLESLLSLVFYRGLAMQVTMKRDKEGRTDFSMVAVNPSRVGKDFTQPQFEALVSQIANENALLLEIVNYNIEGQQYVCAGHLRCLWVLTEVLNSLSLSPSSSPPPSIPSLINTHISLLPPLSTRVTLSRGHATIPLSGIDVPFHSTHLQAGIGTFRRFLETRILERNIEVERLIGHWIPNVMGVPFEVTREFVESVERVTGSRALEGLVSLLGLLAQ